MERKPISITFGENSKEIGIVCNDGTMWKMEYVQKPGEGWVYEWIELPKVPQGDFLHLRLR